MQHTFSAWAAAAGIRAVKTAAQTAVGVIGTAAVLGEVDWVMVISAAVLAAVVSVLTSLAGLPEVEDGKSPLATSEKSAQIAPDNTERRQTTP